MPVSYGTTNIAPYATAPTVPAAGGAYYNTGTGVLWLSNGTTWVQGQPPNGSAQGDLNGTYPNPGVYRINGITISATPPTTGQVLTATTSTSASWLSVGARRLRVYFSANQSIAQNTNVNVVFNTTSYNTSGTDFNTSTGVFTCSVAGLYEISVCLLWTVPLVTAIAQVYGILNHSGGFSQRFGQCILPSGSGSLNPTSMCSMLIPLAVNETVNIIAYTQYTGCNLLAGAGYTSLCITLLGS